MNTSRGFGPLREVPFALAVAAALSVATLAWGLALFALPQADDFTLAADGRELGARGYAEQKYFDWSGRWASHAIIAGVLAGIDPIRHYALPLLALLALQLLGLRALGRAVLRDRLSPRREWILAIGLFTLLFAGGPSPAETQYWFCGAVPYQLSFSLAFLMLAWLCRPMAEGPARFLRTLGCSALALVVAGLAEPVAVASCVVLAAGTGVAFRTRSPSLTAWAITGLAGAAGFLFVYLAPGNEVRAQLFPGAGDLEVTRSLFSTMLATEGRAWILDPKLLAVTLLLVIHPEKTRLRPAWLDAGGVPWRWLVPAVWVGALLPSLVGPMWSIGAPPPPRVLDASYTLFVLGWLLTIFVWSQGRGAREAVARPWRRGIAAIASVGLALALLFSGNFPTAAGELRQLPAWRGALLARFDAAERASRDGTGALEVPRLPSHPQMLTVLELDVRPNRFDNRGFARFFGLDSVRLAARGRLQR